MCLITTQKEPKIATEDIVVYKHANAYEDYVTSAFYGCFEYHFGELYETEIMQSFSRQYHDDFDGDALAQLMGTEHQEIVKMSYVTYAESFDKARKKHGMRSFGPGFHSVLKKDRLPSSESLVIVECTIPKGAEYYIGISDLVVSNKIIVNKIVD